MTTHRDADNVPSDRLTTYADVIDAHGEAESEPGYNRWRCACGEVIATGRKARAMEALRIHQALAVMAVADREQAELHYERDVACNSINQQRVAETALLQSRLDDALGAITRVQALAHDRDEESDTCYVHYREIRAALRGPEPTED